jgi:hypothetical protein
MKYLVIYTTAMHFKLKVSKFKIDKKNTVFLRPLLPAPQIQSKCLGIGCHTTPMFGAHITLKGP